MSQIDRHKLREQVRRLRTPLHEGVRPLSHHDCTLDAILPAAAAQSTPARNSAASALPAPGDRIQGTYLTHRFQGSLSGLKRIKATGSFRVSVRFDTPVNAFSGGSLTVYRNQVTAIVDAQGVSMAKTSDGRPYLVLKTDPGIHPSLVIASSDEGEAASRSCAPEPDGQARERHPQAAR